ncbi:hypothetical protein LCGC14_0224780 [marine sediment metagenome]|uniref:Uncharacterized protein n=1 Tax=marine sediment metagenome TaxID=412755 RepID=A0A0F9UGW5_9ZZZZ
MESCIKCRKKDVKTVKKEILDEIKNFLKDPNNYYVKFNPITKFYKFEKIK